MMGEPSVMHSANCQDSRVRTEVETTHPAAWVIRSLAAARRLHVHPLSPGRLGVRLLSSRCELRHVITVDCSDGPDVCVQHGTIGTWNGRIPGGTL